MIFDFRLKVFYTVAQKLSFTKAAMELFITQPAVTKHIKELEDQFGTTLFTRNGNSISLTTAGIVLVKHAEQIFKVYASLENEIGELQHITGGIIHIGASTTLAEYVLPKILAMFKSAHPALQFTFASGNSEFIESQVIAGKIDLAIVEGTSHHPQLMYEPFVKDEIVMVVNSNSKLAQKWEVKPAQLTVIPFVLRETGSGTLDVIYKALNNLDINPKDLNIEIRLGSTESIKQYLAHTESAAFLSLLSITRELQRKELSIVDVKGLDIYRTFQFIQLQGNTSRISDLFKRFCINHYNFK